MTQQPPQAVSEIPEVDRYVREFVPAKWDPANERGGAPVCFAFQADGTCEVIDIADDGAMGRNDSMDMRANAFIALGKTAKPVALVTISESFLSKCFDRSKPYVSVNADGVFPLPSLHVEPSGSMTMQCNAFYGETLIEAARRPLTGDATEIICCLDRFARPGQGCEFSDLLTVYYFDGRGWRFGVKEYRFGTPTVIKPIDWTKKFWIEIQKRDLQHVLGPIPVLAGNPPPIVLPPYVLRPAFDAATLAEWEARFQGEDPEETTGSHFASLFPGWGAEPRELWFSSYWLEEQLKEAGAEDRAIRRICFANGQRIAMNGDPWRTGQRTLERYRAGDVDTPGNELARQIFNEAIPYFLNMYGAPDRAALERAAGGVDPDALFEKFRQELEL